MTSADELNDDVARRALGDLIARWADARGLELLRVWQALEAASEEPGGPAALAGDEAVDPALARKILATVADGSAPEPAGWARDAIDAAAGAKAHIIDPVSLSIIGATLIGLVLAARVKRIGSAEFYKGVPPEVAKIVKAAAPIVGGG